MRDPSLEPPYPQENVVTYPGVKGNFLRFELQSPINRTGNTWHIQAAAFVFGVQTERD